MLVRQQLATSSTKHYSGTNGCRSITIHETANRTVGADAAAHANLQSRGNVRDGSWHYQVDDVEAVQSFAHTVQCWHAGDGRGPGNLASIAIEICVNADGDYLAAVHNAAALVRHIRAAEPTVTDVVQHNHWSGKNCPTLLRAGTHGITWAGFLALLDDPAPTPPQAPAPGPSRPTATSGGLDMSALPVLKRGSTGLVVKRLQGLLLANGYSIGRHGIDGSWGPDVDTAFHRFQSAHPATGTNGRPDGSCGPRSWSALLGL